MTDDRRRMMDERMRKPLPSSPSIQHSELHKDASRRLGRPNPEKKAGADRASVSPAREEKGFA